MKRVTAVCLGLMLGAAIATVIPVAAQQMSDIKKTDKNTKKAAKAKNSGAKGGKASGAKSTAASK
jgi:hypothetical protein